jgi:hypothetical protein
MKISSPFPIHKCLGYSRLMHKVLVPVVVLVVVAVTGTP